MTTLYRAFVTLPSHLCADGRPGTQERVVFFEGSCQHAIACTTLQRLLAIVWDVDTSYWHDDGAIYNAKPHAELLEQAAGSDADGDRRLLEVGWGGDRPITWARRQDVDLFVTPRWSARLGLALNQAEALS